MSGIFAVAGVQHGMKFTFPRNMIQWQNVFKIEGDAENCNNMLNNTRLAALKLYKMNNKTAASRYYVQNIIGAGPGDKYIPPENLVKKKG